MKFNKNMKIVSCIFFIYIFILSLVAFFVFDSSNMYFVITYLFTLVSFVSVYFAIMYYLQKHKELPEGKANRIYALTAGGYAIAQMGSSLIIIGIHEYFGFISFIYYGIIELVILLSFLYIFYKNNFR